MKLGLSEYEVKEIIQRHLDKNPDLKYYIDNPYFDEFIELLVEGICAAIEANNRRILDDM